jgi:hypothetical protein
MDKTTDIGTRNPMRSLSKKDLSAEDIPVAAPIASVVVESKHAKLFRSERPRSFRVEAVISQGAQLVFPSVTVEQVAGVTKGAVADTILVQEINTVLAALNGVSIFRQRYGSRLAREPPTTPVSATPHLGKRTGTRQQAIDCDESAARYGYNGYNIHVLLR